MRSTQPANSDGSAWDGVKLLAGAFARQPNNWLVLARNLVPVVGVYFFAWSAPITVLSYWWDGVTLLALLIAAVVLRVGAEQRKKMSVATLILQSLFGWVFVFGMCGIPYWMAFGALDLEHPAGDVLNDSGRLLAFIGIFAGNAVSGVSKGFMTIDDAQLKQRAQAGLHTLLVRAALMMTINSWGMGFLLVPFMALALTATEVWQGVVAEAVRWNEARKAQLLR